MCGPAGSGKSTVARRLEAEGMVRLSFDDEAWERGIRSMPLDDDVHAEIEAALRARLHDLLDEGYDVVLDFSFWSRAMREEWRTLLAARGVVAETLYLATPREVVLERLRRRRGAHRDDFPLDEGTAAAYVDGFEPPDPREGPLTVIDG